MSSSRSPKREISARPLLDIACERDNPDVIKDFVALRLGYGVLPRCSVLADARGGKFAMATIREVPLTRLLVRRSDQPENPAAEAIAGAIRNEFSSLCEEDVLLPRGA
jgi:DNA-binding transcriptional LysR family regulator